MIMVFGGLAEGRKNKNAAGVWRPAAIGLVKNIIAAASARRPG
jgi:hypothetical protein